MGLTKNEQYFLYAIKNTCIKLGNLNKILPSLIGGLAIYESFWGTKYAGSKNLYCLMQDNINPSNKIYSINTGKIYNAKDTGPKEDELYPVYIKAYADYRESIDDFVKYLINIRRSPDGPFKYHNLIECIDYKEAVNRLVRDGYTTYIDRKNTAYFESNLIGIIEKNKLYEWDQELIDTIKEEDMSKKKRYAYRTPVTINEPEEDNINEEIVEEETTEEVVEEPMVEEQPVSGIMYRVRLDWEKLDTQIFASINLDDAIEEASKHEGYKVYNGETGEVVCDPWEKKEEIVEEEIDLPYRELTNPSHGRIVILDKTPVYKKATDRKPYKYFSGEFYYYDNTIVNDRAKICKDLKAIVRKDVTKILGYIDIKV